jgi:hypothetical protein
VIPKSAIAIAFWKLAPDRRARQARHRNTPSSAGEHASRLGFLDPDQVAGTTHGGSGANDAHRALRSLPAITPNENGIGRTRSSP